MGAISNSVPGRRGAVPGDAGGAVRGRELRAKHVPGHLDQDAAEEAQHGLKAPPALQNSNGSLMRWQPMPT